jgi:hypothetical protein
MSDFWNTLMQSAFGKTASTEDTAGSIDHFLDSAVDQTLTGNNLEDSRTSSLQSLTQRERERNALGLPVDAGVRVRFAGALGAVMSYDNPPHPGTEGTVVMVRSAFGDITNHDSRVFVKWDTGEFCPMDTTHLRRVAGAKQAQSIQLRVSNLGDISELFSTAGSKEGDLIHKATEDLWSVSKEGDQFVISRLFDDSGQPLKV